ncbi:hypothetical protein J6590_046410 [Homalodisca vitripennis]|nr:hypothetical protein J6590_046410 [Homalodisca vitripennis]
MDVLRTKKEIITTRQPQVTKVQAGLSLASLPYTAYVITALSQYLGTQAPPFFPKRRATPHKQGPTPRRAAPPGVEEADDLNLIQCLSIESPANISHPLHSFASLFESNLFVFQNNAHQCAWDIKQLNYTSSRVYEDSGELAIYVFISQRSKIPVCRMSSQMANSNFGGENSTSIHRVLLAHAASGPRQWR